MEGPFAGLMNGRITSLISALGTRKSVATDTDRVRSAISTSPMSWPISLRRSVAPSPRSRSPGTLLRSATTGRASPALDQWCDAALATEPNYFNVWIGGSVAESHLRTPWMLRRLPTSACDQAFQIERSCSDPRYDPPEGRDWCFLDEAMIDLGVDTTRRLRRGRFRYY